MKWFIAVMLVSPSVYACQSGFIPSDTPGVCVEKTIDAVTNPNWVSDEKLPEGRMPSWQREGISVVIATSTTKSDEEADKAKVDAIKEGKRRAGIR